MIWYRSYRADPEVRQLMDRHYSRQHHGAQQFAPPGRVLVLKTAGACWLTTWPYPQFVQHAWAGAWVCTAFRREPACPHLASDLVRAAVAATRWYWSDVPDLGMITFVDPAKVRRKRDWGRCFRRASFVPAGRTKGGLVALQLLPAAMPAPCAPLPFKALAQLELDLGLTA